MGDDVSKIIYGVLIAFVVVIAAWIGYVFIVGCGFSLDCKSYYAPPERTPIPTLIPARLPIADAGEVGQELEKCRELDPGDERVYYVLGSAYFELNQPEKAIQAYEKFQSIYKGTDSGYREIARYYLENNNQEKAIEYIKKSLEIQPESPESLYQLGEYYSSHGRYEESRPAYCKSLGHLPAQRRGVLPDKVDDRVDLSAYRLFLELEVVIVGSRQTDLVCIGDRRPQTGRRDHAQRWRANGSFAALGVVDLGGVQLRSRRGLVHPGTDCHA